MARYDHGGGCPCGLYKECPTDCEHHPDQRLKQALARAEEEAYLASYREFKSHSPYVPYDPGWAYYVPDDSVADSQYSWDFTKPRVRVKAGSQRVD